MDCQEPWHELPLGEARQQPWKASGTISWTESLLQTLPRFRIEHCEAVGVLLTHSPERLSSQLRQPATAALALPHYREPSSRNTPSRDRGSRIGAQGRRGGRNEPVPSGPAGDSLTNCMNRPVPWTLDLRESAQLLAKTHGPWMGGKGNFCW